MLHTATFHLILAIVIFIMVIVIALEDARIYENNIFSFRYIGLIILYTIIGFVIIESALWGLYFILNIF